MEGIIGGYFLSKWLLFPQLLTFNISKKIVRIVREKQLPSIMPEREKKKKTSWKTPWCNGYLAVECKQRY